MRISDWSSDVCFSDLVRGEAHADMAVVEDRVVGAVSLLDLIERLRDEECLQAVSRHEGQGALEEVESSERRKLVEHHQDAVATVLRMKVFGQSSADLDRKSVV